MTDRLYVIGVIVKGLDGAVEFLVGVILLLAPNLPHAALEAVADRASQHPSTIARFVGSYLESLDDRLAQSGLLLLIVFLILHGAIKLVLVYCLLRKLHRVYPIAMVVLCAFLAYQLYLLVVAPTVTLGILVALDAVIVFLVYREYRELRDRAEQADEGLI